MAVSYAEAIRLIEKDAAERSASFANKGEILQISETLGRTCRQTYYSSITTPTFDTPTTGGFAINSGYTQLASTDKPAIFRVVESVADGLAPDSLVQDPSDESPTCVEIEAGARFPDQDDSIEYDSCVATDDTLLVVGPQPDKRYIQVCKRIERYENRRFAGSDFRIDDPIIRHGAKIEAHHILACSVLGITEIAVYQKPRIGFLSMGWGSVADRKGGILKATETQDISKLYINTVLSGVAEILDLGHIKDAEEFSSLLSEKSVANACDIIITTEGRPNSAYDVVKSAVKKVGGILHLRRVEMIPDDSVLFASIPGAHTRVSARVGDITPPMSPVPENCATERSRIALFSLSPSLPRH
jgi:molybdopterin molybdotransferase